MGKWLDENLPSACRIYASPSHRTMQTAHATGRKYRALDALAPGGAIDDLLAAIHWPSAREPALIVGHQPMLGMIAARLIGDTDAAWTIRKANVWWICECKQKPSVTAEPLLPFGLVGTGGRVEYYLRAVIGPGLLNHIGKE